MHKAKEVLLADSPGKLCRIIYEVITQPEEDLEVARHAKRKMQLGFEMTSNQIGSHMTKLRKGVNRTIDKMVEEGKSAVADVVRERLDDIAPSSRLNANVEALL